jgi:hypothetical protein
MGVPDKSRKRNGHFSASGEYLWYGLSAGLDKHSGLYDVLDLRRKVDIEFITDQIIPQRPIFLFHLCCQTFLGILWSEWE